ncbi:hypothetical protein GCM10009105_35430 [Dokdonella soli]|uniref:Uncharacterized protein n=1 Tax=Dokdonella soli TaxID=529810 RepID=A0ABP3U6X4_9GAMM
MGRNSGSWEFSVVMSGVRGRRAVSDKAVRPEVSKGDSHALSRAAARVSLRAAHPVLSLSKDWHEGSGIRHAHHQRQVFATPGTGDNRLEVSSLKLSFGSLVSIVPFRV